MGLKDATLQKQLDAIRYKNQELANLNENLIEKDNTIFTLRGKILELNNILSLSEEKQISQQSKILTQEREISSLSEISESEKQQSLKTIKQMELRSSQTLEQVALLTNEIDIEMTGNQDASVQFTTHHPGDPNSWSYGEIIDVDFNPHIEFHDYAIEWTPYSIKWFVDNIEVYSQNQNIVDDLIYPQKIMMNLWSAVWIDWVGVWDPGTMPVNSYYNFVKYYEYTPGEGSDGSNNDFTLSWIDEFDSVDITRWEEATHGFNGNNCQFDPVNVICHDGKLILIVSDISYILGDVNNDMILNIIDIIHIVNMILNFEDIINVADYNQDNSINILDLIFIIDQILG